MSTINIDFLIAVLEDYCQLQINGVISEANRYSVSDVNELINAISDNEDSLANSTLAKRIAHLTNELSIKSIDNINLKLKLDQAVDFAKEVKKQLNKNKEYAPLSHIWVDSVINGKNVEEELKKMGL